MTPYRIRPYEDRDYEAVHTIFAQGIMEHARAGFFHVLKCPWVQLLFLGLFLVVLMASGSIFISLVALVLALTGSWFYMHSFVASYVKEGLCSDLWDIQTTYMKAADSCLWVAESNGAVVGMVAAVLPEGSSERGRTLEMKRMSVARKHRGQGIAKALSRTLIRFAQERGYCTVVLTTSMVQYAACRLYESLGFQKIREHYPLWLAWLLQFSFFHYRYEIPGAR